MTNEERIAKLTQAHDLIRDVEFSYPSKHWVRMALYKFIVRGFSLGGPISAIIDRLKLENLEQERITRDIAHEDDV